ncbi:MAG TPA: hypothetical protein DCE78_00660 [Bacteroidetes bacterium]|nr:hypothetical protein [Bacteroidota bacterium]
MKYYTSKLIQSPDLQTLREKVEAALKTQGFGILTEIDIQATMKKKLNKDYLPHVILGACNPVYADKVLSIEPQVSTLLPCNVTIRQTEDGMFEVAAMDPAAAMGIIGNDDLTKHAVEVRDLLDNALNTLS